MPGPNTLSFLSPVSQLATSSMPKLGVQAPLASLPVARKGKEAHAMYACARGNRPLSLSNYRPCTSEEKLSAPLQKPKHVIRDRSKNIPTIARCFSSENIDRLGKNLASAKIDLKEEQATENNETESADNHLQEIVAWICEEIKKQVEEFIDFTSMQTSGISEEMMSRLPKKFLDNSRDALLCDEIQRRFAGGLVSQYRKDENYPSKPRDLRPPSFSLDDLCAHGTNLTSIVSALIHTNKQMVPGLKARKLGVKMRTGESGGTTLLNQRYVSAVPVCESSQFDFDDVQKYAARASTTYRGNGFLQNIRLPSDAIPAVVLGDGIERGEEVESTIGNERVYKRINIRMIAVEGRHKDVALEILKCLGISDIKVCTYDDLEASKETGLQALWDNGVVANV